MFNLFLRGSSVADSPFLTIIRLQDRLPEIAIPLLPGDGDVAIDLQDVFQRSCDAGPYRRRIRYRQTEPVPPLDAEKGDWLRNSLHLP